MTDSNGLPVDDSTDLNIAEDQLEALNEQLGEDVDIEDLDIELKAEYWVDYNHSHHGIVFCWRNNKNQVLLGIEETITPSQEKDGYDIVLMTADGKFIGALEENLTDEEEALKSSLEYQYEYPQGEFPMVEEYQKNHSDSEDEEGVKRGWMIDDNPLYNDSDADEAQSKPDNEKRLEDGLFNRILSFFGL